MTQPIPSSAVELEARGITLDQQIPASAVILNVTLPHAEHRITLTTTTVAPAVGVRERGVVLLTPGFTSSKETFYPIMGFLAERGYRAISFSQRGQPGSSGPTSPRDYPLADLGNDIIALLVEMGLSATPVHLLGHSFGGVVATAAVLAQPSQFASLTLWNSGPKKMEDDFAAVIAALQEHGPRALWVKDRLEDGLDPDADLTGTLNIIEKYYFNRLMAAEPAQLEAALNILATQQDQTAELAVLKASRGLPILISHGAQDDAWPIQWQREMAETLNAEYWVIANAGHSAHADRSYVSAQLLATFWDTAR
ncbi:MAG: alpha/beta hydrolase [Actinomycetales bacterium]|nr:alpha/beta hydrolase [Actinomycetales bacterium]